MTDQEIAEYCGFADHPNWQKAVSNMSADYRKVIERMVEIEFEVKLYVDGVGPKPEGVLLDFERDFKKRRTHY